MRLIRCSICLLATGALVAAGTATAQVASLMPVDEAPRDASLFAFRAQLQSTIARRDVAALLDAVDQDIKISFGDDNGIEAFRTMWHITDRRADAQLWRELGSALAFGGSFQPGGATQFAAPYVYSKWPESFDAFEHVAIVGAGVRVREAPGLASDTLTTLSFAMVPTARNGDFPSEASAENWVAIRLADGRVGYVAIDYAKSPVGYRAFLSKSSGRWRLSMFVAGD